MGELEAARVSPLYLPYISLYLEVGELALSALYLPIYLPYISPYISVYLEVGELAPHRAPPLQPPARLGRAGDTREI